MPSTRQFAVAYKAFYDVEDLNESTMDKVRAIKNKTYGLGGNESGAVAGNHRINTGMRQDPNFKANLARFHGAEANPEDDFYKNYRAFYGGATPNVNSAIHMGRVHQD